MLIRAYITAHGMKLVHAASGEWLRRGHIAQAKDGRTVIIYGGECPAKEPPDGRVFTNKGNFFPENVNARWVPMNQTEEDVAAIPGVTYN
jgi:hypothetical protein